MTCSQLPVQKCICLHVFAQDTNGGDREGNHISDEERRMWKSASRQHLRHDAGWLFVLYFKKQSTLLINAENYKTVSSDNLNVLGILG